MTVGWSRERTAVRCLLPVAIRTHDHRDSRPCGDRGHGRQSWHGRVLWGTRRRARPSVRWQTGRPDGSRSGAPGGRRAELSKGLWAGWGQGARVSASQMVSAPVPKLSTTLSARRSPQGAARLTRRLPRAGAVASVAVAVRFRNRTAGSGKAAAGFPEWGRGHAGGRPTTPAAFLAGLRKRGRGLPAVLNTCCGEVNHVRYDDALPGASSSSGRTAHASGDCGDLRDVGA